MGIAAKDNTSDEDKKKNKELKGKLLEGLKEKDKKTKGG